MSEKPEALRLADILQGQADRDYAFIDDFRYGSAAELRRLHAENERLREALKKYGGHTVNCMQGYYNDGPWPCDCGFEAAMQSEETK